MNEQPTWPIGKTLFMSAGPRSGKTRLLERWRAESTSPTQYLALTPEDGEPSFFLQRMLSGWPAIRARYEQLASELEAPRGALLGMAIAACHPDYCLMLDDFHVSEGTAVESELLALLRHFPEHGTLIVSSRHQLPELKRPLPVIWEADLPIWKEQPKVSDLLELPDHLLAKALAIHVVGEGAYSSEGWELHRRNVVLDTGREHHLRPCWRQVAELALTHSLPRGIWQEVEAELEAYSRRHLRTKKEDQIPAILTRIPSEIRRRSPAFLQAEGDFLCRDGNIPEARECYRMALALPLNSPRSTLDLYLSLMTLALHLGDAQELRDLESTIEDLEDIALPEQQARILYLSGMMRWNAGELSESESLWLRILTIPASGERLISYWHYYALLALTALPKYARTERFTRQLVTLSEAQSFQKDMWGAHVAYLTSLVSDESSPPPLEAFLSVPNESITPTLTISLDYFHMLGLRYHFLDEHELFLRYSQFYRGLVQSSGLSSKIFQGEWMLLKAYRNLGREREANQIYRALDLDVAAVHIRHLVLAERLHMLIPTGRYQEAAELLEILAASSGLARGRGLLFSLWSRHQQGDSKALTEIKALLDTPDGDMLWADQAKLLNQLGLRNDPPIVQLHAFGSLSLSKAGLHASGWPRKKARSLLAHLILHPEGLASETLAQLLFDEDETQSPLDSLHTLVHSLRKVLKSVEAEDVLVSVRGHYQLDWSKIAFCDMHEFDALYQKAASLEADCNHWGASFFFKVALLVLRGSLFENMPDEFEEQRSAYQARVRHAEAFVKLHPPSPW